MKSLKKTDKLLSILLTLVMLIGLLPTTAFANEESCLHANAVYSDEFGSVESTCFEPGVGGYYYCDECGCYLDESKENEYWEPFPAAKKPATGHYFNTDTGVCDECGLTNPVYTKVTSLADINEEDMYIIVAEVEGEESTMYFVLGGLDERHPDEQGNVWCPTGVPTAIRVTANSDGSISLVNQEVLEDGSPSEFMLDINPEQFGDMSELGLTTVMLKLPNHCVYPFQSYSYDNTGYMGVSRYNSEYGMWDSSEWVIDFYTTVVTDDTYRYEDEFGSKTHADQVADGNIGNNITEGNLLLYKASFYAVGGAMFTLRLREYNDEYYFICGEDWALDGSDGWDYVTDTTPTNDTQYAVSLYRYDVPSNGNASGGETHAHNMTYTAANPATCTEAGNAEYYYCDGCEKYFSDEEGEAELDENDTIIDALDHDWSDWADAGENAAADIHQRYCKRNCGIEQQTGNHEWSKWTSTGNEEHKKTCSVCTGIRTSDHNWGEGEVTKPATVKENGVKAYTCTDCAATKTEVIQKIVCDHSWDRWQKDDDLTHTCLCTNGNGCEAKQQRTHKWDDGVVTVEPTETAEGEMTYTCLICKHEKAETIAMLQHTHRYGEWEIHDAETHMRRCVNGNTCTLFEMEEHSCSAWANNEDGTHTGKCSACGGEMVEFHIWSDWEVQVVGPLKRTCECGAYEELNMVQSIEDAVVNTTKTDSNDAKAELVVDNALTLFNDVLTTEEQTAVAVGSSTVSVYLEVTDISEENVSASDKAAAEAVIEEEDNELNENTEIGMYLDINLFKEVTTNGNTGSSTEASQVTETSGKVTITIQIPDELINNDSSVDRIYRIIRVHEDENGNVITDVIDGVFDPVTKTFTFKTDKFSTYALAYNDEEAIINNHYTGGNSGGLVAGGDKSTDGADKLGNEDDKKEEASENTDAPVVSAPKFTDLGAHAWAADAISSLAEAGIIKGTSESTFSPAANITRADFAILLVRAFNLTSDSTENFADVSANDYFAAELATARNTGIVGGIGDNRFAPRNAITRQDMMTIVYRALQSAKVDGITAPEMTDEVALSKTYTDFTLVSDYAKDAVSVLSHMHFVNGKNGRIAPNDYTTRAEVAVLIERVLEYVK